MGANLTKEYAPTLLTIYVVLGGATFSCAKKFIDFVSPNSLVFFYCSISLALGSLGMRDGLSLVPRNVAEYEGHSYTHAALTFMMIGLAFLPLTQVWLGKREETSEFYYSGKLTRLISVFLVLVPVAFVGFDLSILGGSGNLSVYAAGALSVCLMVLSGKGNVAVRYFVFLAIVLLSAFLNPHDKRLAVFLVFPFLFLEARRGALRFSLGSAIAVIFIIFSLLYLILTMSIVRGYGAFNIEENFVEALSLVPEYIKSELFMAAFLQNIEVTYFYFHYVSAFEFVASGVAELALGETIIKPLFLPFPREVIGWKPSSIIDLYTNMFDPSFRSLGGSWPPNFAAEYFWNFHAFGILLFPAFAWFNVQIFNYLVTTDMLRRPYLYSFFLFVYMNLVTYARGSGIDLFVFIIGAGGVLLLMSAFVHRALVTFSGR